MWVVGCSTRDFIDDGDGSENVTFKMNWRFFFQTLSRLFQFAENVKCTQISLDRS